MKEKEGSMLNKKKQCYKQRKKGVEYNIDRIKKPARRNISKIDSDGGNSEKANS